MQSIHTYTYTDTDTQTQKWKAHATPLPLPNTYIYSDMARYANVPHQYPLLSTMHFYRSVLSLTISGLSFNVSLKIRSATKKRKGGGNNNQILPRELWNNNKTKGSAEYTDSSNKKYVNIGSRLMVSKLQMSVEVWTAWRHPRTQYQCPTRKNTGSLTLYFVWKNTKHRVSPSPLYSSKLGDLVLVQ